MLDSCSYMLEKFMTHHRNHKVMGSEGGEDATVSASQCYLKKKKVKYNVQKTLRTICQTDPYDLGYFLFLYVL